MNSNRSCSCVAKSVLILGCIVLLTVYLLCSCSVQRVQYFQEFSRFPVSKLDSVCLSNDLPTSLEDWRSTSYVFNDSLTLVRYFWIVGYQDGSEQIFTVEVVDSTFSFINRISEPIKKR